MHEVWTHFCIVFLVWKHDGPMLYIWTSKYKCWFIFVNYALPLFYQHDDICNFSFIREHERKQAKKKRAKYQSTAILANLTTWLTDKNSMIQNKNENKHVNQHTRESQRKMKSNANKKINQKVEYYLDQNLKRYDTMCDTKWIRAMDEELYFSMKKKLNNAFTKLMIRIVFLYEEET